MKNLKKWYFAMMLAILPALACTFASCDDDKDLPDVKIALDVKEGVVSDGTIYVVQGQPIEIASIDAVNNDASKGAAVTNVNYYWDGYFYSTAVFSPFGMEFATTENTALGNHTIGVTCTVLAVDKSIATAALTYPVKVVASADDLPTASGNEIVMSTSLAK